MTTMTRKGATVEEAIDAALKKLGVSRDEVEIEVLSHGRKGFFGLGAKEAEVKVSISEVVKHSAPEVMETETVSETIAEPEEETVREVVEEEKSVTIIDEIKENETKEIRLDEEAIEESERYLKEIAREMGVEDLTITHKVDGKYVNFQLESEKAALLIGKRGQTLNALQQLTQLVANKYANQFKVVRIDVGDYRDRRQQSLESLADRMADRALRTGRKVQLEPMPPYERKVIHHMLSNRLDIETYSEGSEPYRYLVIEPIR